MYSYYTKSYISYRHGRTNWQEPYIYSKVSQRGQSDSSYIDSYRNSKCVIYHSSNHSFSQNRLHSYVTKSVERSLNVYSRDSSCDILYTSVVDSEEWSSSHCYNMSTWCYGIYGHTGPNNFMSKDDWPSYGVFSYRGSSVQVQNSYNKWYIYVKSYSIYVSVHYEKDIVESNSYVYHDVEIQDDVYSSLHIVNFKDKPYSYGQMSHWKREYIQEYVVKQDDNTYSFSVDSEDSDTSTIYTSHTAHSSNVNDKGMNWHVRRQEHIYRRDSNFLYSVKVKVENYVSTILSSQS